MGILATARRLSRVEWLDLAGAGWRMLIVRIGLGTLSIRRLQRLLAGRTPGRSRAGTPDRAVWQRRARAIRRVGARLPGAHCLARSITLWWWMKRQGLDARIRIGVRNPTQTLDVHAWVELDGEPVDEHQAEADSYTTLDWDRAEEFRRRLDSTN